MPTREEITFIFLDVRLPSHPKIAPLKDGAFRLYVEALCRAGYLEQDGVIPLREWNGMGTARSRESVVKAGLVHVTDAEAVVHDYLDIQRSRAEIEATRDAKSAAGIKGNHRRHHLNRGIRDEKCPLCLKGVA